MGKKKIKGRVTKKPPSVKSLLTDKINEEVIAAALSSVNAPVLIKVCRLCETKDGPFLNIFDSSTSTAKKIEELMPFEIAETDDLPHKICFRCSAKVEELHEFVQKCVKTQTNLFEALGKKPAVTKNNVRTKWEEKLNKSNISNDDICDALIKRAMEGIKNIPLQLSVPLEDDDKPLRPKKPETDSDASTVKKSLANESKIDLDTEVTLKDIKLSIEKCDNRLFPGGTNAPIKLGNKINSNTNTSGMSNKQQVNDNNKNEDSDDDAKTDSNKSKEVKSDPPFNIMDYVTMIKVNSVGTLFQCKLCNRNFLKKQVVETHGCAKTGIPKIDLTSNVPPPEPPKPQSTVKYIKIDGSSRWPNRNKEKEDAAAKKVTEEPSAEKPQPVIKPRPKIGPASKKRPPETVSEIESQKEVSDNSSNEKTPETITPGPTVSFSTKPNLSKLYKLIPGPNNTFTLVDGNSNTAANNETTEESTAQKSGKKRKYSDDESKKDSDKKKSEIKSKRKFSDEEEVIDLDKDVESPHPTEQPYPVGLFQTMPQHSTTYPSTSTAVAPTFTTPAMKKQSYSVVRMPNPSKLVISTKAIAPEENVLKKKLKKSKNEEKASESKEPYNVTIEDMTPPKDPGFFTFINVDPLLQPSYVLPTSNIIQESQISTSTPAVKNKADSKDKYSCNLCGEKFSREKKLLTHIQSHYTKMDEEDKQRETSLNKRKGKKS